MTRDSKTDDDFRVNVYNFLSNELRQQGGWMKILAVDKNGFLLDVISTEDELRRVLKASDLSALVADMTSEGNIGISLKDRLISSDVSFINGSNTKRVFPPDYALKQVITASNNNFKDLERNVLTNNRFTFAFHEFCSSVKNYGLISASSLINMNDERLPYFRVISVELGNLNLFVTELQMSFITSAGVVKIHNIDKDIDFDKLIRVLTKALRLPKDALEEVLSKEY